MQDLVSQMGINRGSLYDTFGDKQTLFQAAIAHYHQTVVRQAIAPLEAPGARKQAIVDHFYGVVERIVAEQPNCGCLLINSVVELAAHDPEAIAQISQSFQRIEDAFYRALVRSQDCGELSAERDLRALARYLLCSLQGLRVMSKMTGDRSMLMGIVQTALSVLDES